MDEYIVKFEELDSESQKALEEVSKKRSISIERLLYIDALGKAALQGAITKDLENPKMITLRNFLTEEAKLNQDEMMELLLSVIGAGNKLVGIIHQSDDLRSMFTLRKMFPRRSDVGSSEIEEMLKSMSDSTNGEVTSLAKIMAEVRSSKVEGGGLSAKEFEAQKKKEK